MQSIKNGFLVALMLFATSAWAQKNTAGKTGEAYTETIPGTGLSFRMMPIPGGKFTMGSPASEARRKEDEGPQHEVSIEPFWMAEFEITWDLYDAFVNKETNGSMNPAFIKGEYAGKNMINAVALPSQPYVDMSFGMGKRGFPAINMTQYAALAFCQWLTAQTGHFYRLPTEAEWEYACRAGSKTAYHFGDDASQLGDYAWFYDNSNGAYHPVGQKKPNPWGLYDMHGNVSEWVLDQYTADFYAKKSSKAYQPVETLYPIAVRGGSWDDDPDRLRSAARRGSAPEWKQRDPQIPKSKWWFTDASFVGFRVIRPVNQPSKEQIQQYFKMPPADL